MADDARVFPCPECGWPALAATRRCPFCRSVMPHHHRAVRRSRPRPLTYLAAIWLISIVSVIGVAFVTLDGLAALAVGGVAVAPTLFLYLLHRRSAVRIRALRRRRSAAGAPEGVQDRNRSTTNSQN